MYQHNKYELLELEINKLKVMIKEKDDRFKEHKVNSEQIIIELREDNIKFKSNSDKNIYDLKVTLAQKDEEIETLKDHNVAVTKIHETNQEEIKSVNNEIKQMMKQIKLKDSEIYRLNKEKSINIEENIKTKKENDKVKEINAKLIIKIANEEDNFRKFKKEN